MNDGKLRGGWMAQDILDSHHWCIFRLFLVSLDDQELKSVGEQLYRERRARRECDRDPARLFLSSLTAQDLERAGKEILKERSARRHERRLLAVLAPSDPT